MNMKRALIVRSFETGEEVRRLDVSGKSERDIERVEMGLLRQMNLDAYYLDHEEE